MNPPHIEWFLNLMVLQALLGAFDTLYHHELTVALPRQAGARLELAIHGVRALLYGLIFYGLAWYQWQGLWTLLLVSIVLIEVGLTLWDFVIEDRSRLLPASERVTHTLLAINGGAAFVLLALELPNWYAAPTAMVGVDYGWQSWFLGLAALGVALSGLRDGWAAHTAQRVDLRLGLFLGAQRRVLVTGATGFIGSALCRELLASGCEVTVISRNPLAAAIRFGGRVRAVARVAELDSQQQFDAIINLAGAPVVGPLWSAARKRVLRNSRLDVSGELAAWVTTAQHLPAVWIQASAVGYYGRGADGTGRKATALDEDSPAGDGFAASLCEDWEAVSKVVDGLGVRRVVLRLGMVFGRSGGSLPALLLPYRFGVGAVMGDGDQRLSWIHIEDLLRLIALAVRDPALSGSINAVAPHSPTWAEFAYSIGHQLQRPVWLRVPAALLRRALGEMATLFVDGPVIAPRRLQQWGFKFRFADVRGALMDLS